MITHARWGCWETNSSTINQIAIPRGAIQRIDKIPSEIMINYDFPIEEGSMITDFVGKVRATWALINEIRFEIGRETQSIISRKPENYYALDFQDILFNTLKRQGISYTVDQSIDPLEDAGLGMLGLAGVTDGPRLLFTTPGYLERFLFDSRSIFTFGTFNGYPSCTDLGYTGKSSNGYDIVEV